MRGTSAATRAAVAFILVVVAGRAALAQSPAEVAARRGFLDEANRAAHAGDHARAIELAERAGRILMTPSIRYFLATEQRAVGRFPDALGNAELCLQQAQRDASVPMRAQVITECRALVTDLQHQVGQIRVRVAAPAPAGLQIRIGGQPLSDAFWNEPFPVAPGAATIEAIAPGRIAFRQDVTVAAGASSDIDVVLAIDPSAPSPSPSPEPSGSPSPTPAASATPVVPPMALPRPGRGPLPIVVAGAGVLLLGGAAVTWFAYGAPALSRLSSCGTVHVCADLRANRDAASAVTNAEIITPILIGVGAVLLVAGVVWKLLPAPAPPRMVDLVPVPGGAMLTFGGVM